MNEDGMSLKSSNSVRKKRVEEKKFPFKVRFEKTLNILKKLNSNLKQIQVGFFSSVFLKFNKVLMFIVTLMIISYLYYFYTYWHLLPLLDSSKYGFTLKFYKEIYWEDSTYRKGIILFLVFHFIFLLFTISLLRTLYTNPGYYEKEYINLYSIIKFVKHIFVYFIKWRDPDFKFNNMMLHDKSSYSEDLEEILSKIEPMLSERMIEFSNSIAYASRYNSIDVTKKNIYAEIEDLNENKDRGGVSQFLNEDILESFENELENFIRNHEVYQQLDKLQFHEKGKDNNRFCGFCLMKKPDRSHHCRQCKKCLRKMDHHCLFLYTCIAYGNYKFFILTLFYGCVILFLMSFTLIDGLKFYINEYGDNLILTIYCVSYFLVLILTTLISYFFYLHLSLLINNLTTIDYIEKGQTDHTNKPVPPHIYSLGFCRNISSVMGSCILWFIPILHEVDFSGYSYEVDRDSYNQLNLYRLREKEEMKNRNLLTKFNNPRNKL